MRGIILFIFQLWVALHNSVVDHQQFSQKTPIMAIFEKIDGLSSGSDNWKEQCNFLFWSDGVSWFLKKVSISLVEFAFDVAFVQTSSGSDCWNLLNQSDGMLLIQSETWLVWKVNVASAKDLLCCWYKSCVELTTNYISSACSDLLPVHGSLIFYTG